MSLFWETLHSELSHILRHSFKPVSGLKKIKNKKKASEFENVQKHVKRSCKLTQLTRFSEKYYSTENITRTFNVTRGLIGSASLELIFKPISHQMPIALQPICFFFIAFTPDHGKRLARIRILGLKIRSLAKNVFKNSCFIVIFRVHNIEILFVAWLPFFIRFD